MTRDASVLLTVGGGVLILMMVSALISGRRLRQKLAGRTPGLAAFSMSMGKPEPDEFVQAIYGALVQEVGRDLQLVRADDDLGRLWGIVDDDLDEVVLRAVELLRPGWSVGLKGQYGSTPRQIVDFLATHAHRAA